MQTFPAGRKTRARLRNAALAITALLAGCAQPGAHKDEVTASWSVPSGPGPALTPVTFQQVPGWTADRASQALPPFLDGCTHMEANPQQSLGGQGEAASRGSSPAQWQAACAAARAVPPGDDEAARRFFEAYFQPYGLSTDGSAQGLFTGYYEPEIEGSRSPGGRYIYPIYRRPPDLGAPSHARPFFTRAEIDDGALSRKRLELLWLADPIDAFFLHIQGSGRIRLPDGKVVRVSFDGQNGQSYVPIGRVLVDRGEMTLDQVSVQTIRAWLVAHPDQAKEVMEQNPSYVFFRELNGVASDDGPPGALGVMLSPGRSVAVDKGYIPLGAPVWVDTKDPLNGGKLQRLMLAHDLGGAIRGPVRTDIFFGWGPEAEQRAGVMRQPGTEILFLPRPAMAAAR
jgi:membrane-bound lytic murein transglycosylase A